MIDAALFADVNFAEEAHAFLATVREKFWNDTGYFGKEKYVGTEKAFLWPYGGHLEAIAAQFETYPDCAHAKQLYIDTLEGLRAYQVCREDDHLAYAAACGGSGDIYYDDNAWLVIAYLDASQNLKDPKWLDLSKRVCRFCYTGWDEKLGGGVYWMVNNYESKNTCINAPLAKVSAQLYKATKEPEFLEMAKKLYAWTKENLMDPADNLYWDNKKLDGTVEPHKWTYNTGCMIGAGVHLYEITGEAAYLEDAKRTARSALNGGFGQVESDGYYRFTKGSSPWFNSWLLDGYLVLYPHDPVDDYILSFASATAYALQQKNATGFLPQNWQTPVRDEDAHILDQSGTATCMYKVHLWKQQYQK